MKKLLILILLLLPAKLLAPTDNRILLFSPILRHPYATIIQTVGYVESNQDNDAINKKEGAIGYYQIRAIRLKDFNQRTGLHFTMKDMHDFDKASVVFMYYASDFAPDDYEGIAREWNKSRTGKYIDKIKKFLDRYRSQRKYVLR